MPIHVLIWFDRLLIPVSLAALGIGAWAFIRFRRLGYVLLVAVVCVPLVSLALGVVAPLEPPSSADLREWADEAARREAGLPPEERVTTSNGDDGLYSATIIAAELSFHSFIPNSLLLLALALFTRGDLKQQRCEQMHGAAGVPPQHMQ